MGTLARDVLFRMPSARLYFCLLIVRYMLSDKIKGKHGLFYTNVTKFMYVIGRPSMHLSTENSAGYLQRVQIFLEPFIGELFT